MESTMIRYFLFINESFLLVVFQLQLDPLNDGRPLNSELQFILCYSDDIGSNTFSPDSWTMLVCL